jgi:hypothetical protein
MSNPTKNFEFIRLYPRLNADPLTGKVGEIYFNTDLNRLRICTDIFPIWEDLSVSQTEAFQDKNAKLVQGGVWIAGVDELTISDDAFIQLPGRPLASNTISAQTIAGLADGYCAYVTLDRTGVSSILPVTVAQTSTLPQDRDVLIVALKSGNEFHVGSMVLFEGQSKTIEGTSREILAAIGASSETDSSGQLRLIARDASTLVDVTAVNKLSIDGTEFGMAFQNKFLNFSGAVINFFTGQIYKEDGVTPLGDNFMSPLITVAPGYGRWYSVTLAANSVNSFNEIDGKLLVVSADTDATGITTAVKANYPTGINLGQVFVFNDGGTIINIIQNDIVQNAAAGGSSSTTSGGLIQITANDPLSMAIPTGTTYTVDNVAMVNGDLILFPNLNFDPGVYKISGVGTSISFEIQSVFNDSVNPTKGDQIYIQKGDIFGNQIGMYNGSIFAFNDVVRYFDDTSVDFWEQTSVKTTEIVNNTDGIIFSVSVAGSENFILSYSIIRGTGKEAGQLTITSDGTTANVAQHNSSTEVTGVSFYAEIDTGIITLYYSTTDTGSDGIMKYFAQRWSDADGGPSGMPNYSSYYSPTLGAAGNQGEVQFNGSGQLSSNSHFKWDGVNNAINLNGLQLMSLSDTITLLDNQSDPVTIITYAAAEYTNVVVDYGIRRGPDMRTGEMLIASNETVAEIWDDYVETNDTGVIFNIINDGSTVSIQYVSTDSTYDATMKIFIRRWLMEP